MTMRRWRPRVLLGLVLALTVGPAACSSAPAAAARAVTTLPGLQWSGYVAQACGSCALRYVTAQWRVPAVNCGRSARPVAWAEAWVGLDGWSSGTVEQIGTASVCTDGQPSYFAWYQMYPAPAVIVFGPGRASFGVNPGDEVTASVYHDPAAGRYDLDLTDHATGLTVRTAQSCPGGQRCASADAEVITEAPSAGADIPLADFGALAYTGIAVTSRNGTHGGMASNRLWSAFPVTMPATATAAGATPGPARAGTAFTDTWQPAK